MDLRSLFDYDFFLFLLARLRMLGCTYITIVTSLFMNDKVGHLLHLGHESCLTVIEVVKEQT